MSRIRSVPMLPGMHAEHRQFLQELRDAVIQLQSSNLPPDDPTNLTVSPHALGNNVQFTRSRNAKRYTLYISNTPTSSANSNSNPGGTIAVDLGDSNYFNDAVGQAAYTRYYWVRAWNGQASSRMVGPVSGVTLAAGAVVDPPKQVPPGTVTIDQGTGLPVTGTLAIIPGHGPGKR